jgi:hypothetical protein
VFHNRKSILMDMDVQKTMEFLLEQQARFDAQMGLLTVKMDEAAERAAEMDERHDREMADLRGSLSELRGSLRQAVRLSVEEQRRERVRRQALDEKMTQLASSQLATDERLRNLLDVLSKRNGSN